MINHDFDQHAVFKLFLNIIYGLCDVNSLTISQATDVYYYADKYQVDIVKNLILDFIKQKIGVGHASTTDLNSLYQFVKLYDFDSDSDSDLGLLIQLDEMNINLDDENCYEFYKLADVMELHAMKRKVIDYCAAVEPNKKWAPEFLCEVIENLQKKQTICQEKIKILEEGDKQKQKNWEKRTPRDQRQGRSSRWCDVNRFNNSMYHHF